ncbi:asparaginase [Ancylostoma caninum]|uniref:Asparaginase n=1 Tax=Ancylostoma caninum TaxID=29170 RepID=A0A368GYE5_ANCCA|nr:asparaginase [Ancylostoma caninum]
MWFLFCVLLLLCGASALKPVVVNTWGSKDFQQANANALGAMYAGRMFALVEGLSTCERLQCDTTVGYGGSPDESGETTLDALVIDGNGVRMGAVANLHRIKDAARVAWAVMNYTKHTMLVGPSGK